MLLRTFVLSVVLVLSRVIAVFGTLVFIGILVFAGIDLVRFAPLLVGFVVLGVDEDEGGTEQSDNRPD